MVKLDQKHTGMKELLEDIIKPGSIRPIRNAIPKESEWLIKNAVFVRQEGSLIKVKYSEILWLKGDGNYTQLVTSTTSFSVRNILKDFDSILPASQFMRIHKSYMVQLDLIDEITLREVRIGTNWIPLGRTFHQKLVSGIQKLANSGD